MSKPSLFRIWISAARLRTLPLSVAGIVVGNALAFRDSTFSWLLFGATLVTAIAFQILSNFANDYGDGVKGTDNENRIGPKRVLQQKLLSRKALFRGIAVTAFLGLLLAMGTIFIAFGTKQIQSSILFVGLALAATIAAYKYTAGKGAYGYFALGDIFVLVFFGGLAVCGCYFLQTETLNSYVWFFALSIGALSVGVLNLNNMRDIQNDTKVGKKTIASILGLYNAKIYHAGLIIVAVISLFLGLSNSAVHRAHYIPLIMAIPLLVQLSKTLQINTYADFDKQLKPLALSAFGLSLMLCITQMIF